MLKNILEIQDCNILNNDQLKALKGGGFVARVFCDNGVPMSGESVPSCLCHGHPSGLYFYRQNDDGSYILYAIDGGQVDSGDSQ